MYFLCTVNRQVATIFGVSDYCSHLPKWMQKVNYWYNMFSSKANCLKLRTNLRLCINRF